MNLVFAGSSDFAVKSLDALIRAGHRVLAVLTQPDRPAGRRRRMTPTPVKAYARTAGLPVMAPESLKDEAVIEKLSRLEPELMVVVDYGLIIPRSVLELPSRGCINGHASLLPRWRGAAPVERAVMAGDRQTGITVMQMEAGLDTGPILLVRSTDIGPDESAGHL
ncbi:MAG: methionyl-tRNA formyltransferase, partial [Gammaproteobacteria bacterium]